MRTPIIGAACGLLVAACSREAAAPAAAEKAPPSSNAAASLTLKTPPPTTTIPLTGGPIPGAEAARGSFSRRTPVVEAVAKARASVVNLSTERIVQTSYSMPMLARRAALYDQYLVQELVLVPMPPKRETKVSLGSGVIVDERGYILTNNHVIDRASRVHVILDDNLEYDATFVAADEVDDLALIKIDVGTNTLRAIDLVDSDELMLGETVIAMGNPYGLSHSISVGVLSATNRPATYRGELLYKDILQTDAAVNPGSSGGPLLNIEGKLLGVNVSIHEEAQNIGFAQPVRRVRQLLGRWLSPQVLKRQWLGFSPEWQDGAVRVAFCPTNSQAMAVGIRPGAIINAVNGSPVADLFTFNRLLLALEEGATVSVTWSRDGETRTSMLKLVSSSRQDGNELAWQRLGIRFQPTVGKAVIPLRLSVSLPIAEIAKDGPAAAAGLQPGRFIWRINDVDIRNLGDVAIALEFVQKGDKVAVGIADYTQAETKSSVNLSNIQLVAH